MDTGLDVLPIRETAGVSDDALACNYVILAHPSRTGCHSNGTNTIGITEGDYSEARQHGDTGVCTLGLFHKSTNGVEYILLIDSEFPRLLKVVGEYVEQKFGIGRSVDVTVGTGIHEME